MKPIVWKMNATDELSLPYRNVHIVKHFGPHSKNRLKDILKKHKMIASIALSGVNSYFIHLFPLMNNITVLSLSKYTMIHRPSEKSKVNFPHLKCLNLSDASCIIAHIRHHKIESIKVAEAENKNPEEYTENNYDWNLFLQTCDNLKFLTLQNFDRDIDFCDYDFKLQALVVKGTYRRDRDEFFETYGYYENYMFLNRIKALIRAHKNSLKKISLTVKMSEDPEILNFLLNDMKLEELNWIYYNKHPMNYVEPKENSTLKKLKFKLASGVSEKFLYVLKTLHAVTHFDVDSQYQPSWNELLLLLHYHMPNLKVLTMRNPLHVNKPEDEQIEEIKTKALQVETLIIHGFPNKVDQRKKFLTCAPNIRRLLIKGKHWGSFDHLTTDEFKIILKSLIKLEEFEFRGSIDIDDEVLTLITQSKLRRITVEYVPSKLDQISEICEKLKAANPDMIVIKRLVSTQNWSEGEVHEIFTLFRFPR